MPYYKYTAKDLNGNVYKGNVFAENEQAFYRGLKEEGLFCIKKVITQEKQEKAKKKLKSKEIAIISRQFSTMLNSGISVIKCIDILYQQAEKDHIKDIFLDIYDEIQKGNSLSSTLKNQGKTFPNLFISMIQVGEESGSLDTSLEKMAMHYDKEHRIGSKIKSAMIYPIILSIVSIAVLLLLMLYVIPTFFSMFEDVVETLPWNTKFLLASSRYLINNWQMILIFCAVLIGSMILLMRTATFKRYMDRIKLRLPIVGKLNKIILSARFAETLATLYSSGLSLIEGIEITQKVINNNYLDKGFIKVKQDIAKGTPLSISLNNLQIFPPMLSHMILIGEESGQLDEILEKTSKFYEQEADTAIQKLISLLEPIMIIILGMMVGFIIASIVPPMYSMYQNIQ